MCESAHEYLRIGRLKNSRRSEHKFGDKKGNTLSRRAVTINTKHIRKIICNLARAHAHAHTCCSATGGIWSAFRHAHSRRSTFVMKCASDASWVSPAAKMAAI